MGILTRLYGWYGKTPVRLILVVMVVLLAFAGYKAITGDEAEVPEPETQLPTVAVAPAGASQNGAASLTLIGTLKAVSQADIQTETAGQITSVNVALGDTVRAGQVIAQQENASERAAVLQAEGAYDGAVAAAAVSDVSVDEAENALQRARSSIVTDYRNNFTEAAGTVVNLLDTFYSSPQEGIIGLRINGSTETQRLNEVRVALRTILPEWQARVDALTADDDLEQFNQYALENSNMVLNVVDTLIALVNNEDNKFATLSGRSVSSYSTDLTTARTQLVNSISTLQDARTDLVAAQEALNRAEIGGTAAETSAANAQVKQALGSLRAAQANLEKTILRTPIAGTVNRLSVDRGDFVGSFQSIAQIANNNALEVTTYVGESDRNAIAVGDAVVLENQYKATVTTIAPAVDPETRKIEVRLGVANDVPLAAGDTVTITLERQSSDSENSALFVPLTAVKFTERDGIVFTVEDTTLVANPVSVGEVRGSFVEITDGIAADTRIVLDARGRAAGQQVEAIPN